MSEHSAEKAVLRSCPCCGGNLAPADTSCDWCRSGACTQVPCQRGKPIWPGAIPLGCEPVGLHLRVADRDGDVWARYGQRWGCLTTASTSQTWSDLWHVCGPLTYAPEGARRG